MPITNGRPLPTWARAYTVGPQKYMRTGPGGGGSSTSDFVYVSKSRIDPPECLVARDGGEHSPELGAGVAAGQGAPDRAQVAPDGLQLAQDRPRRVAVEHLVRGRAQ